MVRFAVFTLLVTLSLAANSPTPSRTTAVGNYSPTTPSTSLKSKAANSTKSAVIKPLPANCTADKQGLDALVSYYKWLRPQLLDFLTERQEMKDEVSLAAFRCTKDPRALLQHDADYMDDKNGRVNCFKWDVTTNPALYFRPTAAIVTLNTLQTENRATTAEVRKYLNNRAKNPAVGNCTFTDSLPALDALIDVLSKATNQMNMLIGQSVLFAKNPEVV